MSIKAVCFDIGETLIDESRLWRGWAAYLGVAADEFLAELNRIIARGEDHRLVFERFQPGFDVRSARAERLARGDSDLFAAQDLYPDALPCLRDLRARGYRIGIAGNQPAGAIETLNAMSLGADFIATSSSLGTKKPEPAFFEKLVSMAGVEACEIVYVGDRLDNDILPARAAGMATVFLLRGPWAKVQMHTRQAALASATLNSLTELADTLPRLKGSRTMPAASLPYRPNVGIALFNAQGRVFIARRFKDDGPEIIYPGLEWQMPQGGIDPNEDPRPAAQRELYEETGVTSVDYLGETAGWMTYEFPPYDGPPHRLAKFRGQRQKWFAFRFLGDEREITVADWRNDQEPEFDAWRWEPLANIAALVVPFRREVYAAVAQEFARFSSGERGAG